MNDFLGAALAIAADRGPFAVTVGSVSSRLAAPVGSFYHRFGSRDALLAELWLTLAADRQQGIDAALSAGEALKAMLHTPNWARENPDRARVLLLHHRDDFVFGAWPRQLNAALAAQIRKIEASVRTFANLAFDRTEPETLWLARFLLTELPEAALAPHLRDRELPPPIVEDVVTTTFQAIVGLQLPNA